MRENDQQQKQSDGPPDGQYLMFFQKRVAPRNTGPEAGSRSGDEVFSFLPGRRPQPLEQLCTLGETPPTAQASTAHRREVQSREGAHGACERMGLCC